MAAWVDWYKSHHPTPYLEGQRLYRSLEASTFYHFPMRAFERLYNYLYFPRRQWVLTGGIQLAPLILVGSFRVLGFCGGTWTIFLVFCPLAMSSVLPGKVTSMNGLKAFVQYWWRTTPSTGAWLMASWERVFLPVENFVLLLVISLPGLESQDRGDS